MINQYMLLELSGQYGVEMWIGDRMNISEKIQLITNSTFKYKGHSKVNILFDDDMPSFIQIPTYFESIWSTNKSLKAKYIN